MGYIELKNVTYTYPLAKESSIKEVTFSLKKGKFYAVVGANGSGKTTLCNIIRGFIPGFFQGELEGEVLLEGKSLQEYTMGELAPKIMYFKILSTRLQEPETMCMRKLPMDWKI